MTDTAPAGLSDQPPGGPVPGPVVLPDPAGDPGALALALVDVPSVSGAEAPLADAVQAALAARDR